MEITATQLAQIAHGLPRQRGNVSLSNLQVLNAILYVAEHGCKWRGLPKRFGNWHTIYTRMSRWAKSVVLDRAFEQLQQAQVVMIKIEAVSLDSTSVKVHPDGTGAPKKDGPQAIGKSRGGWNTKIHLLAADARTAVTFSLRQAKLKMRRKAVPCSRAGVRPIARCICSWTAPARATRPGSWLWTSASFQSLRPCAPRSSLGSSTARCTSAATRSSGGCAAETGPGQCAPHRGRESGGQAPTGPGKNGGQVVRG